MTTSAPPSTAAAAERAAPRQPSRWWRMRWSMRALLLAITVLALLLAWVGRTIRAVQHRAALVTALKSESLFGDQIIAWSSIRVSDSFEPDWPAIFLGDWSSVELTDIDVDYKQAVNDDLLEQVAVFRQLEDVSVSGQQITDRGFAALRGMEKLDTLTIEACDITDATLEHIATLRSLEDLTLRGVAVTDKGLGQLWKLPKLNSLTVEFTLVSPKALKAFQNDRPECVVAFTPAAGKPQVEAAKGIMRRDANIMYDSDTRMITAMIFDLDAKPWRPQDWALLEAIPEIQAVSIDELPSAAESIRRVQKLPNVERLVLQSMPVTPSELTALASFPKLNNLDFQPDNLTDAHLAALGRLQNLRELRIQPDAGAITRRGVESLAQLKQLKLLRLSNVTLLDEDLEALAGLELLATLDLSSTPITDQALDHVLRLPRVTELILDGTQITGAGAQRIMKAQHILSATWSDTGIRPELYVRPASPSSVHLPSSTQQ
jgi:Leucine-rich repeat (LRR) protein